MAVGRPELMPSELVWVCEVLDAAGPPPGRMARAVREIKRQRDRALAQEQREIQHSRRMRERFPTDPERSATS